MIVDDCIIIITHRIHVCYIFGNMDPINIPPMLAYIYTSTMDPMGNNNTIINYLADSVMGIPNSECWVNYDWRI